MMLAASCSAAVVKLVCGVGNNAAWVVMMEGYDHAKRCKGIRRGVKGGHLVGWYFKRAINDFNDYERHLLRAQENRMFHLADMSEDVRRKYGDISDDEYYEFWKGVGAVAYGKTKPMVTSLWNEPAESRREGCRARCLGDDHTGSTRPCRGALQEVHRGVPKFLRSERVDSDQHLRAVQPADHRGRLEEGDAAAGTTNRKYKT